MSQQPTSPDIPSLLKSWYGNFVRNTSNAVIALTLKDAIRLVMIIGAYMLLIRPFLVQIGVRIQARQHEEASKEADAKARLNGNDLREKIAIPGVDSDSETDDEGHKGDVKTGEWGRKARLRQRRVVQKALLMREQRLEDESDEDIKEFLVD
jgi:hypothetical protein